MYRHNVGQLGGDLGATTLPNTTSTVVSSDWHGARVRGDGTKCRGMGMRMDRKRDESKAQRDDREYGLLVEKKERNEGTKERR
jgi:hypothetical protein